MNSFLFLNQIQKVTLKKVKSQEEFTFQCKRWLDKKEGDKKIELDLQAEEKPVFKKDGNLKFNP